MLDDDMDEYAKRIEFLLGKISPAARIDAVIRLASGVPAVEVFDGHLDRLSFFPHRKALVDLTNRLTSDEHWPRRRGDTLSAVLQQQIDDETRRRVDEEITRPFRVLPPAHSRLPQNSDDAFLEVSLEELVHTGDLRALLSMIAAAYAMSLASDRIDGLEDSDVFNWDQIREASNLMIELLEIGTPNRVSVLGRAKNLAAAAAILTGVLGVPVAATEAFKNYQEGAKYIADAQDLRANETVARLDAIDKANKLYDAGKIPKETLDEVYKTAHVIAKEAPAAGAIVKIGGIAVRPRKL